MKVLATFCLVLIIGLAQAGLLPAATLLRTPALDTSIVQSDRIGSSFAYRTIENHGYTPLVHPAVHSAVHQYVHQPLNLAYTHVPTYSQLPAYTAASSSYYNSYIPAWQQQLLSTQHYPFNQGFIQQAPVIGQSPIIAQSPVIGQSPIFGQPGLYPQQQLPTEKPVVAEAEEEKPIEAAPIPQQPVESPSFDGVSNDAPAQSDSSSSGQNFNDEDTVSIESA